MSFLLYSTQISTSQANLKKHLLSKVLPLFWKFSWNLHLDLCTPPRTWSSEALELFSCLLHVCVFSLLDRVHIVASLKPISNDFGYKLFFPIAPCLQWLEIFSHQHIMCCFHSWKEFRVDTTKSSLSMTDAFLNNLGYLWRI